MIRRNILMAAIIGLLAVVAIVGWARRTESAPQALVNPPVTSSVDGPGSAAPFDYGAMPAYASLPPVRTINARPAPPPPSQVSYGDRGERRSYYAPRRYHRRSTGKSVAIVAGSAGAGAAIGALAGGGKGAGIGALAGGAGGFIYDRLTHKRPAE